MMIFLKETISKQSQEVLRGKVCKVDVMKFSEFELKTLWISIVGKNILCS